MDAYWTENPFNLTEKGLQSLNEDWNKILPDDWDSDCDDWVHDAN